MDVKENMSGKYWRTCSKDITSSEGWFKKILLLGLISFIPVFGQMTLQGYAYEWAHKAAWGVAGPMPKKIYGRTNSPLLRWGWFAFAICFIISLIPAVVTWVGSFMLDAGVGVGSWGMYGSEHFHRYGAVTAGGGVMLAVGTILLLVGLVASFAAIVIEWVACMRMTMYNRFGAGMQFGKVFKMIGHDFGGIMRIFGMYLLTTLIIVAIVSVLIFIVVLAVIFAIFAFGMGASSGFHAMDGGDVAGLVLGLVLMVLLFGLPLVLVCIYIELVMCAWQTLLVARAVGYWTAQFDVAHWGRKDDPLPFEKASAAAAPATPAEPMQIAAPVQGASAQQPAPEQDAPAPLSREDGCACSAPTAEPGAAPGAQQDVSAATGKAPGEQ